MARWKAAVAALAGPGVRAGAGGTGQGGALYSESGSIVIERTMVLNNFGHGGDGGPGSNAGSAGDGGGLVGRWVAGLEEFTGVVRDIVLESIMSAGTIGGVGGNGGNAGDGQGGSIFAAGGSLTIDRSTLASGISEPGRGGSVGRGGLGGFPNELMRELELRGAGAGGNGIIGGPGSSAGGGLYADNARLAVVRSTLTDHQAGEGGAALGQQRQGQLPDQQQHNCCEHSQRPGRRHQGRPRCWRWAVRLSPGTPRPPGRTSMAQSPHSITISLAIRQTPLWMARLTLLYSTHRPISTRWRTMAAPP